MLKVQKFGLGLKIPLSTKMVSLRVLPKDLSDLCLAFLTCECTK